LASQGKGGRKGVEVVVLDGYRNGQRAVDARKVQWTMQRGEPPRREDMPFQARQRRLASLWPVVVILACCLVLGCSGAAVLTSLRTCSGQTDGAIVFTSQANDYVVTAPGCVFRRGKITIALADNVTIVFRQMAVLSAGQAASLEFIGRDADFITGATLIFESCTLDVQGFAAKVSADYRTHHIFIAVRNSNFSATSDGANTGAVSVESPSVIDVHLEVSNSTVYVQSDNRAIAAGFMVRPSTTAPQAVAQLVLANSSITVGNRTNVTVFGGQGVVAAGAIIINATSAVPSPRCSAALQNFRVTIAGASNVALTGSSIVSVAGVASFWNGLEGMLSGIGLEVSVSGASGLYLTLSGPASAVAAAGISVGYAYTTVDNKVYQRCSVIGADPTPTNFSVSLTDSFVTVNTSGALSPSSGVAVGAIVLARSTIDDNPMAETSSSVEFGAGPRPSIVADGVSIQCSDVFHAAALGILLVNTGNTTLDFGEVDVTVRRSSVNLIGTEMKTSLVAVGALIVSLKSTTTTISGAHLQVDASNITVTGTRNVVAGGIASLAETPDSATVTLSDIMFIAVGPSSFNAWATDAASILFAQAAFSAGAIGVFANTVQINRISTMLYDGVSATAQLRTTNAAQHGTSTAGGIVVRPSTAGVNVIEIHHIATVIARSVAAVSPGNVTLGLMGATGSAIAGGVTIYSPASSGFGAVSNVSVVLSHPTTMIVDTYNTAQVTMTGVAVAGIVTATEIGIDVSDVRLDTRASQTAVVVNRAVAAGVFGFAAHVHQRRTVVQQFSAALSFALIEAVAVSCIAIGGVIRCGSGGIALVVQDSNFTVASSALALQPNGPALALASVVYFSDQYASSLSVQNVSAVVDASLVTLSAPRQALAVGGVVFALSVATAVSQPAELSYVLEGVRMTISGASRVSTTHVASVPSTAAAFAYAGFVLSLNAATPSPLTVRLTDTISTLDRAEALTAVAYRDVAVGGFACGSASAANVNLTRWQCLATGPLDASVVMESEGAAAACGFAVHVTGTAAPLIVTLSGLDNLIALSGAVSAAASVKGGAAAVAVGGIALSGGSGSLNRHPADPSGLTIASRAAPNAPASLNVSGLAGITVGVAAGIALHSPSTAQRATVGLANFTVRLENTNVQGAGHVTALAGGIAAVSDTGPVLTVEHSSVVVDGASRVNSTDTATTHSLVSCGGTLMRELRATESPLGKGTTIINYTVFIGGSTSIALKSLHTVVAAGHSCSVEVSAGSPCYFRLTSANLTVATHGPITISMPKVGVLAGVALRQSADPQLHYLMNSSFAVTNTASLSFTIDNDEAYAIAGVSFAGANGAYQTSVSGCQFGLANIARLSISAGSSSGAVGGFAQTSQRDSHSYLTYNSNSIACIGVTIEIVSATAVEMRSAVCGVFAASLAATAGHPVPTAVTWSTFLLRDSLVKIITTASGQWTSVGGVVAQTTHSNVEASHLVLTADNSTVDLATADYVAGCSVYHASSNSNMPELTVSNVTIDVARNSNITVVTAGKRAYAASIVADSEFGYTSITCTNSRITVDASTLEARCVHDNAAAGSIFSQTGGAAAGQSTVEDSAISITGVSTLQATALTNMAIVASVHVAHFNSGSHPLSVQRVSLSASTSTLLARGGYQASALSIVHDARQLCTTDDEMININVSASACTIKAVTVSSQVTAEYLFVASVAVQSNRMSAYSAAHLTWNLSNTLGLAGPTGLLSATGALVVHGAATAEGQGSVSIHGLRQTFIDCYLRSRGTSQAHTGGVTAHFTPQLPAAVDVTSVELVARTTKPAPTDGPISAATHTEFLLGSDGSVAGVMGLMHYIDNSQSQGERAALTKDIVMSVTGAYTLSVLPAATGGSIDYGAVLGIMLRPAAAQVFVSTVQNVTITIARPPRTVLTNFASNGSFVAAGLLSSGVASVLADVRNVTIRVREESEYLLSSSGDIVSFASVLYVTLGGVISLNQVSVEIGPGFQIAPSKVQSRIAVAAIFSSTVQTYPTDFLVRHVRLTCEGCTVLPLEATSYVAILSVVSHGNGVSSTVFSGITIEVYHGNGITAKASTATTSIASIVAVNSAGGTLAAQVSDVRIATNGATLTVPFSGQDVHVASVRVHAPEPSSGSLHTATVARVNITIRNLSKLQALSLTNFASAASVQVSTMERFAAAITAVNVVVEGGSLAVAAVADKTDAIAASVSAVANNGDVHVNITDVTLTVRDHSHAVANATENGADASGIASASIAVIGLNSNSLQVVANISHIQVAIESGSTCIARGVSRSSAGGVLVYARVAVTALVDSVTLVVASSSRCILDAGKFHSLAAASVLVRAETTSRVAVSNTRLAAVDGAVVEFSNAKAAIGLAALSAVLMLQYDAASDDNGELTVTNVTVVALNSVIDIQSTARYAVAASIGSMRSKVATALLQDLDVVLINSSVNATCIARAVGASVVLGAGDDDTHRQRAAIDRVQIMSNNATVNVTSTLGTTAAALSLVSRGVITFRAFTRVVIQAQSSDIRSTVPVAVQTGFAAAASMALSSLGTASTEDSIATCAITAYNSTINAVAMVSSFACAVGVQTTNLAVTHSFADVVLRAEDSNVTAVDLGGVAAVLGIVEDGASAGNSWTFVIPGRGLTIEAIRSTLFANSMSNSAALAVGGVRAPRFMAPKLLHAENVTIVLCNATLDVRGSNHGGAVASSQPPAVDTGPFPLPTDRYGVSTVSLGSNINVDSTTATCLSGNPARRMLSNGSAIRATQIAVGGSYGYASNGIPLSPDADAPFLEAVTANGVSLTDTAAFPGARVTGIHGPYAHYLDGSSCTAYFPREPAPLPNISWATAHQQVATMPAPRTPSPSRTTSLSVPHTVTASVMRTATLSRRSTSTATATPPASLSLQRPATATAIPTASKSLRLPVRTRSVPRTTSAAPHGEPTDIPTTAIPTTAISTTEEATTRGPSTPAPRSTAVPSTPEPSTSEPLAPEPPGPVNQTTPLPTRPVTSAPPLVATPSPLPPATPPPTPAATPGSPPPPPDAHGSASLTVTYAAVVAKAFPPSAVPVQVTNAVSATAAGATTISSIAAMGNPAVASQAGRLAGLRAALACRADYADPDNAPPPPDPGSNPFDMVVGDSNGGVGRGNAALHGGTVVFGLVAVGAFTLATLLGLGGSRHLVTTRNAQAALRPTPPFGAAVAWARWPGVATFALAYFLQPVVASSVVCLVYASSQPVLGVTAALGLIAIITVLGGCIGGYVKYFRDTFEPIPGEQAMKGSGPATWLFSASTEWTQKATSPERAEVSSLQASAGGTKLRLNRLKQFGIAFDPYADHAPWYFIVEMMYNAAGGAASGVAAATGCLWSVWLSASIALAYLVIMLVIRPYARRFDLALQAFLAAFQALGAVLAAVDITTDVDPYASSPVRDAADWVVIISAVIATVLGVFEIVKAIHHQLRLRLQKLGRNATGGLQVGAAEARLLMMADDYADPAVARVSENAAASTDCADGNQFTPATARPQRASPAGNAGRAPTTTIAFAASRDGLSRSAYMDGPRDSSTSVSPVTETRRHPQHGAGNGGLRRPFGRLFISTSADDAMEGARPLLEAGLPQWPQTAANRDSSAAAAAGAHDAVDFLDDLLLHPPAIVSAAQLPGGADRSQLTSSRPHPVNVGLSANELDFLESLLDQQPSAIASGKTIDKPRAQPAVTHDVFDLI
jgi:hypothetical protein